jgi:hypothetical protein
VGVGVGEGEGVGVRQFTTKLQFFTVIDTDYQVASTSTYDLQRKINTKYLYLLRIADYFQEEHTTTGFDLAQGAYQVA